MSVKLPIGKLTGHQVGAPELRPPPNSGVLGWEEAGRHFRVCSELSPND